MRRTCLLLAAVLLAGGAARAQDTAEAPSPPEVAVVRPTEHRVAENVILVRDPRMRQTHFTLVVHAGCLDEVGGCRGVAHYLEHLLLVGRNADHAETAFRFFADGYANGWTSQRATAYVHRVAPRPDRGPLEDLERLFSFYANRLRGFEVSAADAERERNVVLQEYRVRTGNTPFGRFGVLFESALIPDHPVGARVIGNEATIRALSPDDARQFHGQWYAPNNTTVVVAGNLEPEALRAIVERTLKAIPQRPLPERLGRILPAVNADRAELRELSPGVRRRSVSYAKLITIPETPKSRGARSVLNAFLGSQLAGSPHDVLVEQRGLTDGVSAALIRHLPGLYSLRLSGEPVPEVEPADLAKAFEDYVAGLGRGEAVPAPLVERLKRRLIADFRAGGLTGERAMGRVVDWVANDEPYEALALVPERTGQVVPADLQPLLAGILGPGRVLTGYLLPESDGKRVP